MKRTLGLLIVAMLVILVGCSSEKGKETPVSWDSAFSDAGFTDEEISEYREIFETIGVADFHDVDIIENGVMHIVTGKVYDSSNLQLNVTLENRSIIYVELAGIPDQKTEAYINWRGKLKTKTVDTKTAVEMYSDTEGGYLAVLDWDTKTVSEYEN